MKEQILDAIRAQLATQLQRLRKAAKDAHEAATDPDSKAESKYDTRNLEASYLASGQARQLEELAEAARMFEQLSLPDYSALGAVGPGALVEFRIEGENRWFLLVPAAGGLEVDAEGSMVTLLSPDSPLYQNLLDACVGDRLTSPAGRVVAIH